MNHLALIPDFIANCGMARVFVSNMSNDLKKLEDQEIFEDTSHTIKKALEETYKVNSKKQDWQKPLLKLP